jgi:hypothetical protein
MKLEYRVWNLPGECIDAGTATVSYGDTWLQSSSGTAIYQYSIAGTGSSNVGFIEDPEGWPNTKDCPYDKEQQANVCK